MKRWSDAVERFDARKGDGGSQVVEGLRVRERDIAEHAVVRKALGVRSQRPVRLLQLRDQVRQLFVSLAARIAIGERRNRFDPSVFCIVFLGCGRHLERRDAFGILHDGAAVHEERTADGCEHPLGRARDEGDEQAVVAQVGNRLPTALDRVRMACCRVAQRRDAAHDERSARVLEPAIGLELRLHGDLLAFHDRFPPSRSICFDCANTQRFLPVSLPWYSARSADAKFSPNVSSGS